MQPVPVLRWTRSSGFRCEFNVCQTCRRGDRQDRRNKGSLYDTPNAGMTGLKPTTVCDVIDRRTELMTASLHVEEAYCERLPVLHPLL
jgi:hypothetical protein